MKKIAKIRFNTNYPIGKKWRMIIDEVEYFYDEIIIKCESYTSTDNVLVGDKFEQKYHISCAFTYMKSINTENNLFIAVLS